MCVFVTVQFFLSPSFIVLLQSAENVAMKVSTRSGSLTLYLPGPRVTSVGVSLPRKVAGCGLFPVTVIEKSAGTTSPQIKGSSLHTTTFLTINVAVVLPSFELLPLPKFRVPLQATITHILPRFTELSAITT